VTTKYVYDGGQVIAEYDGSDNPLRKFVYGPGIDEPIIIIDVADNNTVYYYHFDGLGSVAALSDTSANVVETYSYDVFGGTTIKDASDNVLTESAIGNPYGFTGRRLDTETDNYYYRMRYYNPEIGRFLQPDPPYAYTSMGLYHYCWNNPINWVDPIGADVILAGHGRGNWHMSIQVDRPDGGYNDYTYVLNNRDRSWFDQVRGQFWWGGTARSSNGIVIRDAWGRGNSIRVLKTTPEQDASFIKFLDSQLGTVGPYSYVYNCRFWSRQMFDGAVRSYGIYEKLSSGDNYDIYIADPKDLQNTYGMSRKGS